jgi:hypothetical protein
MAPKEMRMEQEELLTTREATKVFKDAGLSETTFRKRVKDGLIKGYMPEGRRRGALYQKEQVLAAASEATKKNLKIKSNNYLQLTTFCPATTEDMTEVAMLLETLYKAKISAKKRMLWIEKNPEIAYILKSNDSIVGCAFILPLAEKTILNSLNAEVKPAIHPEEIITYKTGNSVYLYLRSVGVIQETVSSIQYRYWTARLILGLINKLTDLGSRGISVKKVYAQGDTKQYQRALKLLGFVQIPSTSPLHKNYMLDISTCYEEISMRYKRAFNQWQTQYEEE